MRLVERHIIKDNRFEDVCLKSGLLYNYVLFNVRQGIFSGDYINEYEFSTKLCKENQVDFRNLPSVVSQQVVAQVFLDLIITVGLDYKTLCDRFENMEPEHNGEWGNKEDMDNEASFVNLVKDRDDDGRFAILWNFSSDDDITIKNTCHESFHIAMSVCQFCNMSLGFKVGEDEHAAYIAGFAGDCVSKFINSKNTD